MEAVSEPVARLRALDALRSRDFRLIWAGQTVSLIGDGAFLVALGWKTFDLTGSTGSLALVLMAHGLAMLATLLIGGALADRYERRALMIVSDLARFGVIAGLALTDAAGQLTLPLLIAFAVGFGAGDGFFYPAFGSIVPLVVEPHQIASANTVINISRQGAYVVGPALAGVIYGLHGSAAIFGFDAATFLVAAGLLWRSRPRAHEAEPRQGTFREIASGFRYVMGVPWLWISIFVASFILMVAMAPYQSLLPAFVDGEFGRGVGTYGLLFTVQSAGMVAGTLFFGQTNPRRRRVILLCAAFALNDACVVAMALFPLFESAVALVTLRGAFIGYGIGVWTTLMMELVPESKLARVTSLDFFGSFGLVPVGFALTAVVSDYLEPRTILLTGFSIGLVLWLAPLAYRPFREAA
ncbi:MAG: MFS transporter [Actinomycetota bacterium]|nr:MFS transporter [Actinomycetota bacterium]